MSTTHYLSADPGRRFIKDFTTDPADACIGGIAGHDVDVDPRYVLVRCVRAMGPGRALSPGARSDRWVGRRDNLKILTPNVLRLDEGFYRCYYTGMGDGAVHPDAQGYILSAVSDDARRWQKEPGVRVDVDIHERGSLRVVCPDVVQLADGRHRMYFEARSAHRPNVILSAISDSAGLDFTLEPGLRVSSDETSFGAPRVVFVPALQKWRMYTSVAPVADSGMWEPGKPSAKHILSALSEDGLRWHLEEGVRVPQEHHVEAYSLYVSVHAPWGPHTVVVVSCLGCVSVQAPEILYIEPVKSWRMYYAAWEPPPRAESAEAAATEAKAAAEMERVYQSGEVKGADFVRASIKADLSGATARLFSATSEDGLTWVKDYDGMSEETALLCPGDEGDLDAVHLTEPCLVELQGGGFRLFWESCDRQGAWRILSATMAVAPSL